MDRKLVTTLGIALFLAAPGSAQAPLTPRDSALHALNRLAYGPRPGEVERVAAMGVMTWIERQLAPDRIPDRELEARESGFELLALAQDDLAELYAEALRERERARRAAGDTGQALAPNGNDQPRRTPSDLARRVRRLAAEFPQLAVVRATLSDRQLYQVLADFWANHFNVFAAKGADRFLTPSYIEETIRPLVLGRFDELLIATAQSPAMLFYLDNARSVAPGSRPPELERLARVRRRPGRRMPPSRADSLMRAIEERLPQGINENYARELLELHTLGVDGGYTQEDVVEVARVFTGWGISRPRDGYRFEFHAWAHDRGEKTVLGVRYENDGVNEGLRLLRALARHHATMHFVSGKLCARFVADEPPDGCVDAAVEAWHHSDGDLREVVRAIVRSPDFWAPHAVRAKVKTPLEYVVSAVRAVGGDPDTTPRLAQVVARLGQPLYLQPAPTGYPETQADWVNSGALLARMNFAVALAAGRVPGVRVNLDDVVPVTPDVDHLIALLDERVLSGTMTDNTRQVLRRQLADVASPAERRALAVGLAIGGPEFQRQ